MNYIDPLGLVWFKPKSAPYYVGSENTPVPPGPDGRGRHLDNYFPAMHDMASQHDPLMADFESLGLQPKSLPWWIANITTMVGLYPAAVIANIVGPGFTEYETICTDDAQQAVDQWNDDLFKQIKDLGDALNDLKRIP